MNKKRLLTLDDLMQFCSSHQLSSFDAHEAGYSICVQMPATFEEEKKDDEGLIAYGNIRILHVGENRNGSAVTMDAAKKCAKNIAYVPLLASFATVDGVEDFTTHDLEIQTDADGNETIVYNEKQVGSITADKAEIEHDNTNGKDYLVARAAIPKTYTHAADIIARKNGTTKVSAELQINAFSKEKDGILNLTDVDLLGVTFLGTDPATGQAVNEGMEGANFTLDSFSLKNNSGVQHATDKTNEIYNMLKSIDSKIDAMSGKNGGKSGMNEKITKLLAKYSKNAEDITFDIEGKSDEELEKLFAENFGAKKEEGAQDNSANASTASAPETFADPATDGSGEGASTSAPASDPAPADPTNDPAEGQPAQSAGPDVSLVKAAREKRNAVADAVRRKYADEYDYDVTVFDGYVIEYSYRNDKYYKEDYVENKLDDGTTVYTFPNQRVEVFMTFLTAEEVASANAKAVQFAELEKYKEDNEKAKRDEAVKAEFAKFDAVLNGDTDYEALKANNDGMSIDDIDVKLNSLVGKKAMFSYSQNKEDAKRSIPFDYQHTTVDKPYGGLFD